MGKKKSLKAASFSKKYILLSKINEFLPISNKAGKIFEL